MWNWLKSLFSRSRAAVSAACTPEVLGCFQCGSANDLCRCRVCQKLVCSDHRLGTGSVSEGYTCGMACDLKAMGW